MASSATATATAAGSTVQNFQSLFEDEQTSDVRLLVGVPGVRERIPAHRRVLVQGNEVLRGRLSGPSTEEYYFDDDQPRGFRNFIRWLYGCGCSPSSTQDALVTLQVAIKYQCVELVQHMVFHLVKHLHPDNVLQIMAWGHQYTIMAGPLVVPSAPPAEEESQQEHEEDLPPPYPGTAPPPPYESIYDSDSEPRLSLHLLVSECFSLLDSKADQVLAGESLEDVFTPLVSAVLSRDTLDLGVRGEELVLDALERWSSAECRRLQLPLTLQGRRQVLGQMLTLPRLLTLSPGQLHALGRLYEPDEVAYVTAVVKGDAKVPPVPAVFAGFTDRMAMRRQPAPASGPTGKKNKKKGPGRKKQLMWDIISVFAHMID